VPPWDKEVLSHVLLSGALRAVEELYCGVDAEVVMGALARGAFPDLRMVSISAPTSAACLELAAAMQLRYLTSLRQLTITSMEPDCFQMTACALMAGSCPNLTKLDIPGSLQSLSDWQAMEQLLRSPASRGLEVLNLDFTTSHDGRLMPVVETLRTRCCPGLTKLGVSAALLSPIGASALSRLLISGCLPHLRSLSLADMRDKEAVLVLLDGIQSGQMQSLAYINLSFCGMDARHGIVLREVLKKSVWPMLERLSLSGNENMREEGMLPVMQGLEVGRPLALRKLEVGTTGMGTLTAGGLARALAAGALANLHHVNMSGNRDMGNDAVVEVVGAMRNCVKLSHFNLEAVGMGREAHDALQSALADNAWPALKSFVL